jgi:hypothetical protein
LEASSQGSPKAPPVLLVEGDGICRLAGKRTPASHPEELQRRAKTADGAASSAAPNCTAFAVDGREAVRLCLGFCFITWNTTGTLMYISFPSLHEESYALPVEHDTGLPKLPPSGIERLEDLTNAKTAAVIPQAVNSAISPSIYAYTSRNIRRNLYRISLP